MIEHVRAYMDTISELLGRLDAEQLAKAADMVVDTVVGGNAIFLAGNGGSAATANHFAADFGKNIVKGDEGRPRILSLCCNMSSVTAYANDEGYEYAFSRQLANWGARGDLLIVISASGNSPSVVRCAELARRRDMRVIAMTGFDGGRLMRMADICLHAPDSQFETVEDLHSLFCHLLVYCAKTRLG